MNINGIVSSVYDYIQANTAGSVAAAVILLYLLIKKPKMFLILIIISAAAYGVMRIFLRLSATGLG